MEVKAQRCCRVWPAAHSLLESRVMCRGPAAARFATLMTWPPLAGTTMLHCSKHNLVVSHFRHNLSRRRHP